MEDLGVRMVGPVQMHLSSNRAWCTALLIHLPPQHTVSYIQNYPRSLTVPQFRPSAFATYCSTCHSPSHLTFLADQTLCLFVPYY